MSARGDGSTRRLWGSRARRPDTLRVQDDKRDLTSSGRVSATHRTMLYIPRPTPAAADRSEDRLAVHDSRPVGVSCLGGARFVSSSCWPGPVIGWLRLKNRRYRDDRRESSAQSPIKANTPTWASLIWAILVQRACSPTCDFYIVLAAHRDGVARGGGRWMTG